MAIFTVVYSTFMQPVMGLSLISQNNLEVAELFWEEGPQEERQEKDSEDKKIDLSTANITENLFGYRTQLVIHNGHVTLPLFISAIHIPPPEQA